MTKPKWWQPMRLMLLGLILVAAGLLGFHAIAVMRTPPPAASLTPSAAAMKNRIQVIFKSLTIQAPVNAFYLDQGVIPHMNTRLMNGVALCVEHGRLVHWWTFHASWDPSTPLSLNATLEEALGGPSTKPVEHLSAPPPGFHPQDLPSAQYQVWRFSGYRLVIATAGGKTWAWQWNPQGSVVLIAPIAFHSS